MGELSEFSIQQQDEAGPFSHFLCLSLVSAQEADQTEVADSNYDLHSSNVQLLRQEREAKKSKMDNRKRKSRGGKKAKKTKKDKDKKYGKKRKGGNKKKGKN